MSKRFFCLILCFCLFTGCKYSQVVYTVPKSPDVHADGSYYKFENDTLLVTYSFWGPNGVMSFMVYNKLSIPIYIDWKKSSYIDKSKKLNYYIEKETKEWKSVSANYINKYPINSLTVFGPTIITESSGSGTSVKEERVTFIPPQSYIYRDFYIIFPNQHFICKKESEVQLPISEGASKTFPAFVSIAEKTNSALFFRNFLTYSTTESFEKENYVNNEFFVNKVITMKQKYFDNGTNSSTDPRGIGSNFEDHKGFYIPDLGSVDIFPEQK